MRNRGDELKDLLCWGRADLISELKVTSRTRLELSRSLL